MDSAGRIFSKNALDFETKQFYQFLVTTTDGQNTGITSATATVQVTVLVNTCIYFILLNIAESSQQKTYMYLHLNGKNITYRKILSKVEISKENVFEVICFY